MRFEARLSRIEQIERAKLDAEFDAALQEWFALLSDEEHEKLRNESCDLSELSDDELVAFIAEECWRETIADKRANLRRLRARIAEQQHLKQLKEVTAEETR